jgi:hypothetical protein
MGGEMFLTHWLWIQNIDLYLILQVIVIVLLATGFAIAVQAVFAWVMKDAVTAKRYYHTGQIAWRRSSDHYHFVGTVRNIQVAYVARMHSSTGDQWFWRIQETGQMPMEFFSTARAAMHDAERAYVVSTKPI